MGTVQGAALQEGRAAAATGLADATLHPAQVADVMTVATRVLDGLRNVVVGHDEALRTSLVCVLCGGHLLIEDLPGMGKTTMAKALAGSLGLALRRLQCTADLLPADVTGTTVPSGPGASEMVFRAGPVFTNVLLADELNRASPRTQSALLEAMEEQCVTVDGVTHALPRPFVVIATQNPYDAAGTYRLPHSLRDRFMCSIGLGYPSRTAESELMDDVRPSPADLTHVTDPATLEDVRAEITRSFIAPSVRGYLLDLVEATRQHPDIAVGASPRATIALARAAAGNAAISGRRYVMPEDVKATALAVFGHRLVVTEAARLAGMTASNVVDQILSDVAVPVEPS